MNRMGTPLLRRVGPGALLVFLGLRPAAAQLPTETLRVTGTVVAEGSRAAIPNAIVSFPALWISRLSGDAGDFTLDGVPAGTQILRVQQFGYEDLEVVVDVREGMEPLDVRLLPDPVELRELSVEVDGAVTVTGRVVDARTREPMAGVYVWLPSVEEGAVSDSAGEFRIPEIPTGPLLLQIEHTGYGRQYLPVVATPPWHPMLVEMEPDLAVLAGLAAAERQLRIRRNRYRGVVKHFDATRLLSLGVETAWKVVQAFTFTNVVACQGSGLDSLTGMPLGAWCVQAGRQIVAPIVCIDDRLRLGGLDVLQDYRPHELAGLEMFGTLGTTIRAYTHGYMETMARSEHRSLANLEPEAGSTTGLGWETRWTTRAVAKRRIEIPAIGTKYEGAPC